MVEEAKTRGEEVEAKGDTTPTPEAVPGERDESAALEFVLRFAEHVDDEEFQTRLDNFFKDNCHRVDLALGEEHTHEYFELWHEYQAVAEEMLQGFVQSEGLASAKEAYLRLKQCCETAECAQQYMDYCLSCMEYEAFATTLKEHWRRFALEHGIPVDGDAKAPSAAVAEAEGKRAPEEGKASHK